MVTRPAIGRARLGSMLIFASSVVASRPACANGGVGLVLLLVPSEVGAQTALSHGRALPQARIGWAYQIPFCWFAPTNASDGALIYCADGNALLPHRAVISVGVGFGAPVSQGDDRVSFDSRVGYRYRFSHMHTPAAPYFGFGAAGELWRDHTHVGISPELGIHFGAIARREELSPGILLGFRADAYFAIEPHVRWIAFVGWTIL